MIQRIKCFSCHSFLFSLCFFSLSKLHLESTHQSRNLHDHERAAWGGNGGSWGNIHSDWQANDGNYETHHPTFNSKYFPLKASAYPSSYGHDPYQEAYDKNENVNGAGFYFNFPP